MTVPLLFFFFIFFLDCCLFVFFGDVGPGKGRPSLTVSAFASRYLDCRLWTCIPSLFLFILLPSIFYLL